MWMQGHIIAGRPVRVSIATAKRPASFDRPQTTPGDPLPPPSRLSIRIVLRHGWLRGDCNCNDSASHGGTGQWLRQQDNTQQL